MQLHSKFVLLVLFCISLKRLENLPRVESLRGHLHNYLLSSAKFWTLSVHPPRALSSWGSFIRTCGSFRQLIKLFFFSQIKNNIVYKICIYNLRLTSTEKKPNAPHQDFLILRIIFVIIENMHESEPHVDLKRLIYHQAIKSS